MQRESFKKSNTIEHLRPVGQNKKLNIQYFIYRERRERMAKELFEEKMAPKFQNKGIQNTQRSLGKRNKINTK